MKRHLQYKMLALLPVLFAACVWIWAHRPAQNCPIPGYAWVATTDGTLSSSTARITAVLGRFGISSVCDTMLVADFYVPTNQLAKARVVLAWQKLVEWKSVRSVH